MFFGKRGKSMTPHTHIKMGTSICQVEILTVCDFCRILNDLYEGKICIYTVPVKHLDTFSHIVTSQKEPFR